MDFFDLVKKRRSVRKFSNENVPDEVILKALKQLCLLQTHPIYNHGNFIG